MTLKTLHGRFEFAQQMYQVSGQSIGFMEWSQPSSGGYVSRGLEELVSYYSNRLSYAELGGLIQRLTGADLISSQGAWAIVQANVQQLSEQLSAEFESATTTFENSLPLAADNVDLYERNAEEILLMDDGILVKA